jgi:hypothetical protein
MTPVPKRARSLPTDKKAREIGQVYQALTTQLERLAAVAIGSGRLQEQGYFNARRAEIYALLKQAQDTTNPAIAEAIREAYEIGSLKSREWLAAFYGTDMNQPFSKGDQMLLEMLTDRTINKINDEALIMGQRTQEILRSAALDELVATNVSGEDFEDATEQLTDALERAGVTYESSTARPGQIGAKLIKINGRNYNAADYSELLVRTESRAAHSQATIQRLTDNDHDVVQITDHRTSCDVCGQWDGNKYSLTGATEGLEILSEYPPFHPNCRHLITAALP